MKNILRNLITSAGLVLGMSVLLSVPAGAINVFTNGCSANGGATVCKATAETVNSPVQIVIQTLLMVVGIIAVIMIIVGGIRYTLSNGDASRIKSAKDTVLYAVIGLIVAILAYAIVNFVIGRFIPVPA